MLIIRVEKEDDKCSLGRQVHFIFDCLSTTATLRGLQSLSRQHDPFPQETKARQTFRKAAVQVLLGLVLDIKNNRKRAGRGAPAPPAALAPAAQKFLKDAGVDAVQLRSLPWAKLLAPEHKARLACGAWFAMVSLCCRR